MKYKGMFRICMIVIIIITFVISVVALNDASRANNRLDDSIVTVQESENPENIISDVEYMLKRMVEFNPYYELPFESERINQSVQYSRLSDKHIGVSDRDIIKPLRWGGRFRGTWPWGVVSLRKFVYKKDDDGEWSKCAHEHTYQSNKEYKVAVNYKLEGEYEERLVISEVTMKALSTPSSISNEKRETIQERAFLPLLPHFVNNMHVLEKVSVSCDGEQLSIDDLGKFDIPKSYAGKELSVKSKLKYKDNIYERMYTVAEFDDE